MKLNGRKKTIQTQSNIFYIVNNSLIVTHFYFPCRCTFKNIFNIFFFFFFYTASSPVKQPGKQILRGGRISAIPLFPGSLFVTAPGSRPPLPGHPAWPCFLCVLRQVPWPPGPAGCPEPGWSRQSGTCWQGSGPDLGREERWKHFIISIQTTDSDKYSSQNATLGEWT